MWRFFCALCLLPIAGGAVQRNAKVWENHSGHFLISGIVILLSIFFLCGAMPICRKLLSVLCTTVIHRLVCEEEEVEDLHTGVGEAGLANPLHALLESLRELSIDTEESNYYRLHSLFQAVDMCLVFEPAIIKSVVGSWCKAESLPLQKHCYQRKPLAWAQSSFRRLLLFHASLPVLVL